MQIPEPNDSTPKSILITQLLYAMSEANYINSNLKNKDLECEIAQLKANEISLSEKIVNLKYDLTEVIENNKLINNRLSDKNKELLTDNIQLSTMLKEIYSKFSPNPINHEDLINRINTNNDYVLGLITDRNNLENQVKNLSENYKLLEKATSRIESEFFKLKNSDFNLTNERLQSIEDFLNDLIKTLEPVDYYNFNAFLKVKNDVLISDKINDCFIIRNECKYLTTVGLITTISEKLSGKKLATMIEKETNCIDGFKFIKGGKEYNNPSECPFKSHLGIEEITNSLVDTKHNNILTIHNKRDMTIEIVNKLQTLLYQEMLPFYKCKNNEIVEILRTNYNLLTLEKFIKNTNIDKIKENKNKLLIFFKDNNMPFILYDYDFIIKFSDNTCLLIKLSEYNKIPQPLE
jgi:hypothetical protein